MHTSRRLFTRFLCFIIATVTHATVLAQNAPLSSIAEIKALTVEEAQSGLPLKVEAQLLKILGLRNAGFFFDDGQGIYVSFEGLTVVPKHMRPGEIYEITGITDPGAFLPHITSSSIKLIDYQPLSQPKKITAADFGNPALDCQWVEFVGTIVGESSEWKNNARQIVVRCAGGDTKIIYTKGLHTEVFIESVKNKLVRIRAVAAYESNVNREIIEHYFHIAQTSDIKTLPQPSKQPVPISEILENNAADGHVVKLQGVVTHSKKNDIFIREETGAIHIKTVTEYDYPPGTVVSAEGVIRMEGVAPLILATRVDQVDTIDAPEPVPFDLSAEVYEQYYDKDLITLDATIVSASESNNTFNLICEDKGRSFGCVLQAPERSLPNNMIKGTRVRITGICELEVRQFFLPEQIRNNDMNVLLRSIDDILILKKAPWWTTPKILSMLTIILAITLIALTWAITLRRRVAQQTATIGEQIERESILQERQRIAREMHDSLQQNMTGVSMQLDNLEHHLNSSNEKESQNSLHLAKRMLSHCRKEANASICELRDSGTTEGSLALLLEEQLQEEARLVGAKLEIITEGEPFGLSQTVAQHFLRVAREAFSNAIHHAEPKLISIVFDYNAPEIELRVTDDGVGFDTSKAPPNGHFGLTGMHERAAKIDANLEISSDVHGTIVKLNYTQNT